MNGRDLFWILALEVLSALAAGASFGLISDHVVAGIVAGTIFIFTAGVMLRLSWRWSDRWRSLTLYLVAVHLFLISVPMLATRLMNMDRPFSELNVWGLSGPDFHQLSTKIFSGLVIATAIDLVRVGLRARRNPK